MSGARGTVEGNGGQSWAYAYSKLSEADEARSKWLTERCKGVRWDLCQYCGDELASQNTTGVCSSWRCRKRRAKDRRKARIGQASFRFAGAK